MPDNWAPRDLPVLIAAAEHLDRNPGSPTEPRELARNLPDLDRDEVARALHALSPTYLTTAGERAVGGEDVPDLIVTGLTDEGRRAAGLWPKRANITASLIAALETAAEDVEDEDER